MGLLVLSLSKSLMVLTKVLWADLEETKTLTS